MAELLSTDFVEHHITTFPWSLTSESWGLEKHGVYYQLDLKMCQIRALDYSFVWDDESMPAPFLSSVLETPSKIVRLDISLNELTSLTHDGLLPFRNLRILDASLNQLKHLQGIEVLPHLHSLNLSHNNIKSVDGLSNCHSLGELNLSNNLIEDISNIPSLISLRVLNINNNKVQNLNGVSSFPKLEEIYANHNELKDLVPLTVCPHLHVLSATNNQIKSLESVIRLISQLKYLQSLNLSGNPVERSRSYQSDILKTGNILTLDNISIAPKPSAMKDDHKRHADNIYTLRDAAREAFEDRMRIAKERMEENVNFLQRRILSIQNEYREFEQKLKADLEACMRYLDSLSEAELADRDRGIIGVSHHRSHEQFSYLWQNDRTSRQRGRQLRTDYKNIRETDELLRCAFNELIRQRDHHTDL